MSELFQTSSAGTTLAPAASYSASLKYDETPAPSSIRTLNPGLTSLATLYGQSVGKQQKEVQSVRHSGAHKDTGATYNSVIMIMPKHILRLDETCHQKTYIRGGRNSLLERKGFLGDADG